MYCTMCLKFYFYDEATFPSLINIISVIYLSNNTDILCHHSIIVIQKWIDTNTITLFNYRFKLFTYPVRNTSIGSVIRFLSLQREMACHNRKNKKLTCFVLTITSKKCPGTHKFKRFVCYKIIENWITKKYRTLGRRVYFDNI